MTWVEAVPGIALLFGCITLAVTSGNLHKRHRYRGCLDNRVSIDFKERKKLSVQLMIIY